MIGRKYALHRSKYNVTSELAKRTYNGVVYDSVMEMRYFIDIVEPLVSLGQIVEYERQKKYILQEGFKRKNKTILPITYVADYYIRYSNGLEEVIDVKGLPDSVAKIKRKMFWNRYPDIEYRWLTYNKSHGGWIGYEELQKIKTKEKKAKAKTIKMVDAK